MLNMGYQWGYMKNKYHWAGLERYFSNFPDAVNSMVDITVNYAPRHEPHWILQTWPQFFKSFALSNFVHHLTTKLPIEKLARLARPKKKIIKYAPFFYSFELSWIKNSANLLWHLAISTSHFKMSMKQRFINSYWTIV